jgi:hypothetical protein
MLADGVGQADFVKNIGVVPSQDRSAAVKPGIADHQNERRSVFANQSGVSGLDW